VAYKKTKTKYYEKNKQNRQRDNIHTIIIIN